MTPLRRLLNRPALAALVVAMALVLRLLVPVGYMPVAQGGRLVLAICSGAAPAAPMTHAGMGHHRADDAPVAPDAPCAFADLALPLVGGAEPAQPAAAMPFVAAAAPALPTAYPRAAARHLRPPSHAPPLPA